MDNATDSLDPLASVLHDDIGIIVDGFGELVIPYHPASVWLRHLFTNPDPVSVILAIAGRSDLSRTLLRGTVGVDQLREPCRLLVEAASGRHWWVVANLVSVARASWDVIGGRLAMAGVDPSRIPLGAWLDAAWIIMLDAQADQAAVEKLRFEMGREPTTGRETEDDLAVSEEEFDRVVAMAQGV
jgi:hypothetical protein